jgi:NADH-quinone oxidoreductase subunit M
MASLGLPGLAGFWGEMLAIRAALDQASVLPDRTFATLAVLAAFGVILTSAYFLAVIRGMLQGAPVEVLPVNPGTESVELVSAEVEPGSSVVELVETDVHAMEWVAWSPLILLTLVFGVAPGLLLSPVGEAVVAFFGGM